MMMIKIYVLVYAVSGALVWSLYASFVHDPGLLQTVPSSYYLVAGVDGMLVPCYIAFCSVLSAVEVEAIKRTGGADFGEIDATQILPRSVLHWLMALASSLFAIFVSCYVQIAEFGLVALTLFAASVQLLGFNMVNSVVEAITPLDSPLERHG